MIGSLKTGKLPRKVRRQVPALCEGGFVERAATRLAAQRPQLLPRLAGGPDAVTLTGEAAGGAQPPSGAPRLERVDNRQLPPPTTTGQSTSSGTGS